MYFLARFCGPLLFLLFYVRDHVECTSAQADFRKGRRLPPAPNTVYAMLQMLSLI
jgi:hypothetical protein